MWGFTSAGALIGASIVVVGGGSRTMFLIAAAVGAVAGFFLGVNIASVIVLVGHYVGLEEDGRHLRRIRDVVQNLGDLVDRLSIWGPRGTF